MKRVTLGGDRLGAGKKMKVELKGFERSNNDMSYIWRSTMAAGTLTPFMHKVVLPGDTWDINLKIDVKTLPTIGPMFGSYKIQADIFQGPIRLYQALLHNNKLRIGLNMETVLLPIFELEAYNVDLTTAPDIDNAQLNPSSIMSYLGLRGIGIAGITEDIRREFNAVKWILYWDIVKNFYANKQEELGAVIHTPIIPTVETITGITVQGNALNEDTTGTPRTVGNDYLIVITYAGARPNPETVILQEMQGRRIPASEAGTIINETATTIVISWDAAKNGTTVLLYWRYVTAAEQPYGPIGITTFQLQFIDDMREEIMKKEIFDPFKINTDAIFEPYSLVLGENQASLRAPMEGLALKTYQSDLFNNWMAADWIDGPGSINEITAIDTSDGSFTVDALRLATKVNNMLNRVAVSGGSYDDWLEAVYSHDSYTRCEIPMYHGSNIRELAFQEVVSNAEATGFSGTQPLGTLAGKGTMTSKDKGGNITVKVDEPGYIIGIISITPRIDYSQGNTWDMHLKTMNDFHKPDLDQIGFEDLQTEQMAWWTTVWDTGTNTWTTRAAGKQPAWMNYRTSTNVVLGEFAVESSQMFMTLNRRYEPKLTGPGLWQIQDLTTYIDPRKYNHIFANTRLDAQNFWVQIAVNCEVRRKISARLMPTL